MLEFLFNKFIDLQAYNFTKKRLQLKPFPENIANFKNTYFEKHLQTAGFDSSYILHRKLNKIIQEADWPSRLGRCHSRLLDVSLVCLFVNDHYFKFRKTHRFPLI